MDILDIIYLSQVKDDHLVKWHSRNHSHPAGQYEFHFFIDGTGVFRNGKSVYPIGSGKLFLTAPGQDHEIRVDGSEMHLSYYALLFEVGAEDPVLSWLEDPGFRATFPRKLGQLNQIFFEDAKNAVGSSRDRSRTLASVLRLEALLIDLYCDFREGLSRAGPPEAGGEFNLHIDQVIALLKGHVYSRISLNEICSRLKITNEYLIRLFKKKMKITPMRYFNKLKMETATSLLINSDLSVKEISSKLDFADQQNFSRNFKKYAGCTPTEYRARYFKAQKTDYNLRILPKAADRRLSSISDT